MDPTKDNSDFAGPMNGRAFGTSGFSRLGKTLNEQRQAESEQRGVREGVQNFKRMERIGRRAYRDALRSGNSMGAFQVLQEMDKGGFSSGGIRQAGAVENRLMSQFESRKGMLSGVQGSLQDRQSFAQDLNRSALIQSGDEGALQRAYDRGARIGVGRDAIDRYLGRDATTSPVDATAPAAPPVAPAQPSTWSQITSGPTTPAPGSLLSRPQPGLPVPSFVAGQAATPLSLSQDSAPQTLEEPAISSTPLADRLRALSEANSLISSYRPAPTAPPVASSGFASTQFQPPALADLLGQSFLRGGMPGAFGPPSSAATPAPPSLVALQASSQPKLSAKQPEGLLGAIGRDLSTVGGAASDVAREAGGGAVTAARGVAYLAGSNLASGARRLSSVTAPAIKAGRGAASMIGSGIITGVERAEDSVSLLYREALETIKASARQAIKVVPGETGRYLRESK